MNKIHLNFGKVIICSEIVSVVLLLISAIPLFNYDLLVDLIIPSHYNLMGEVDGWSDRSFFSSIFLIEVLLFVLCSICQLFPSIINIPFNINRKAPEVKAVLIRMASFSKMWLVSIFTVSIIFTYMNALGKTSVSPFPFCMILLGIMALSLIYYVIKLYKMRVH